MSEEREPVPAEAGITDELEVDPEDIDASEEIDEEEELDTGEDVNVESEPSQREEQPPLRKPKEQRAVEAWRKRAREAEAERKRLQEHIFRQQPQPQPPPVDPYRQAELDRLEAEQVAMLPVDQQIRHYVQKALQPVQRELANSRVQTGDQLDRQIFAGIKRDEPSARRLEPQVEEYLAAARAQGMNPTREAIYNLLIGQEVRQKAVRQAEAQRRTGRRRIASQTTRTGVGRSTAAGPRQGRRDDTESGLDDRLRQVKVGDMW